MKKLAFLSLACLLFIRSGALAQGTSNKGTDFWVAYTGHVDGLTSRLTLFLTSPTNATVQINAGGTALPPVTLTANQAVPVVIDPTKYTNTYVGLSDGISQKSGIHVTSDVPIVVYSHISHTARSAATLIFPTVALGREYYAAAYLQSSNNGEIQLSEFTIIGVEDNTEVQITPTQQSATGSRSAGIPFKVTLNKGDVYQYQSATDISGSKIETTGACKPIAVFSGSTKTQFCETGISSGSGDNLYQQLTPVSAWGKNFVTAPFYNTIHGSTDIYRVIVGADNTTLKVNGSGTSANGVTLRNPYAKGSIITFTSQSSNVIQADQPISLTQLQTTQACNPKNAGFGTTNPPYPGDPEMTVLSPIEQTLTDVTLYSAVSIPVIALTNITSNYINIIMETADIPNLRIDGQAVSPSQFVAISNSVYSYLIYDVTASSASNPSHRVTSAKGFVAIAYGYGSVESYGYLGGSDLKNLNQYLVAESFATAATITSSCVKVPLKFALRLPYITSSINWDLGDGTTYTDSSPAYTVDNTSGSTVYLYTYSKPGGAIYTTAGSYNVKAVVVNPAPTGCNAIEEVDYSLTVNNPPTAIFTAVSAVCEGLPVTFTDKSTDPVNAITHWAWDFGDGKTDTVKSPVHTYATRGTYTVKFSVTSSAGCSSDFVQSTVTVNALPVAKFTYPAPDCETKGIVFTDASTAADGIINAWTWDFGDGSTPLTASTNAPVTHVFTVAGTYSVTLKVSTDKSCTSSVYSSAVIIYPQPVADFVMPGICQADGTAKFTNNSSIPGNAALTCAWTFGDNVQNVTALNPNTSNQLNPSHSYALAGNYTVTLTVTSANGCFDFKSKVFTVNGSTPKSLFTVQNSTGLCSNQPVNFVDNSSVTPGSLTKIEWYFDNGNPSVPVLQVVGPTPGKVYAYTYPSFSSPATKIVSVRLVAYSGTACADVSVQPVILKAVPIITFNAIPPVCMEKSAFQLTASAAYYGSGIETYAGDGVSSTGLFDPAKAGVGDHTITYTYTATTGCQDQQTQVITVYPTPTVNAGKDLFILQGGEALVNAAATGNNLTYAWSPVTGLSNPAILNPVASPQDDITYTLTVTSAQGCSATDAVFVKVLKSPEVPNTFTPNGDGINDVWNIKYLESYPGANIEVFNRYGAKVYVSVGYPAPWDGRVNGTNVPEGVYYYIINPRNGRKLIYGSVTIIR